MQSSVNADTDVYCGVMVNTHSYANGGWNDPGSSIYKKAGDTLTDEDLKNLCLYEVIAGFIDKPVNDASEITGFYSAGQVVSSNLDLYIVRSYVEYEKGNGETGTLYWLGDGNTLFNELAELQTEGYEWRFDNANGEIFDENSFESKYNSDETDATSPQTAARFKVVETAS